MYECLKKSIFTIVGAVSMGAFLELFLVPLHIVAGGVGGVVTLVNHLSGLSVGLLIFLINVPIFFLGAFRFDKKFLCYSLLGTLSLSLATQFFSGFPVVTDDPLLAAIFGGAGIGISLGLVISVNGTTGGTDILALVLKQWFPRFSVGQFFMVIDGLVILAAGLVFGEWESALYSALSLFACSKVLDAVLAGVDYGHMVYIMSDYSPFISQEIYREMNRGVTGLQSISMYHGKEKIVLLCVIRKVELPKLKKIVHSVDEEAFVIVSDAREILGKGFKLISF